MNYMVTLNNGTQIELIEATINIIEFTANLNNPATTFVAVGGSIINKHTIMSIAPSSTIQPEGTTQQ